MPPRPDRVVEFIPGEEWRAVPGYACEASNLGRTRTLSGRVYRPHHDKYKNRNGYLRVGVKCPDGQRRNIRVHQLVCLAFHGDPPFQRALVRHLNGDGGDNRPENLAWGTPVTNAEDNILLDKPFAHQKLTNALRRKIAADYWRLRGRKTRLSPGHMAMLIEKYQLRRSTISQVVRRLRQPNSVWAVAAFGFDAEAAP